MKYRDFTVSTVLNGFIIKIGCQTVVASTPKELAKLVEKYMDNPEKTEKEMIEKNMVFNNGNQEAGTSFTVRNGTSGGSTFAIKERNVLTKDVQFDRR